MRTSYITAFNSATRRSICRGGHSLLELIITIAIIGVIVTLSVALITDDAGSARVAKLESDISTLNQMVALYVADGGSVAGLTSPQAVLDKMKRIRPQSEWQRHAGAVTGRLVDVRLRGRTTAQPDSDNNPRAVWNKATQRFELSTASGTAVSDFYLDESLAGADFGTETRAKLALAYNSDTKGWIWGAAVKDPTANYLNPQAFGASNPANGFDPNESAPTSGDPPADGGSGGSGGGGSGGGGGGSSGSVTALPRPVITPSGGTFAFASFPSSATINSNGALPGVSKLMYRINSGAWVEYTGSPVPITPAMNLQARNETTLPAEYSTSSIISQTYYRLASGFSGSGEADWGDATGGANLVSSFVNSTETSTFKHGNTRLDLGNGEYLDAGVENELNFTRESFNTVTPNTWFKFGEMMMLNGTTFYNSEASGVTLTVDLSMTEPSLSFTTDIEFALTSTENTSDRLASADVVEIKNPTTDVRVTIDGIEYRLELSWATLDPGAGVVQGNKFLIYEGATAQAELRARFTSNR